LNTHSFGRVLPPPPLPFLWQNGNLTDFNNINDFDGSSSEVFDINNSGQVVGRTLTSSRLYHAFLWQNGTKTYLGNNGSDNSSVAVGINNSGQVVGWSYQASSNNRDAPDGSYHAVLWQNGSPTNLGTLPGDNNSRAFAINKLGQVFGVSYQSSNSTIPSTQHIFRWQNGTMTNFGNLVTSSPYAYSTINQINNRGQVVGTSINTGHGSTAYIWKKGSLTYLDSSGFGGTLHGEALGINAAGTVVGYLTINGSINRAFVWRDGTMRNLNNLLLPNSGWELNSVVGINNKGQIIGTGKFNGQNRAFILTPVTVSN